ncbi:MAG: DUF5067 domain-containing protein [Clostridia bacterium]|nr:DUF5067 domain-containing protein [Clostridia bacterium]
MKAGKWIVALFLAFSLIFTLCACDKDDKKKDDEEEKQVDYSVEIAKYQASIYGISSSGFSYKVTLDIVYTNQGKEAASFNGTYGLEVNAYQNGIELEEMTSNWDNGLKKIQPGASITFEYVYVITPVYSMTSSGEVVYEGEIDVEIEDYDGIVKKQTIKIDDIMKQRETAG